MNWATIALELFSLFQNTSNPSSPVPGVQAPNQTIKAIQEFLNFVIRPQPPLVVDGWFGPKTEAALKQAIGLLTSILSGIKT